MEGTEINIQQFYPEEMEILVVKESETGIEVQMKLRSRSCKCPHCGMEIMRRSATYRRRAQDLPILGKSVILEI